MIVIKKIVFLGIIIISLCAVFFVTSHKENISLTILPKSISITKTGNPVQKKVINTNEDIEKIMNFIKSINLQEKLNTSYKGYGYAIYIIGENGTECNVSILGDKISYNNSFYTIDSSVIKEFDHLYSELNYPEEDPLI